jgi:hypothetical protein
MVRNDNADGRLEGGIFWTSLEHLNDTKLVLAELNQR